MVNKVQPRFGGYEQNLAPIHKQQFQMADDSLGGSRIPAWYPPEGIAFSVNGSMQEIEEGSGPPGAYPEEEKKFSFENVWGTDPAIQEMYKKNYPAQWMRREKATQQLHEAKTPASRRAATTKIESEDISVRNLIPKGKGERARESRLRNMVSRVDTAGIDIVHTPTPTISQYNRRAAAAEAERQESDARLAKLEQDRLKAIREREAIEEENKRKKIQQAAEEQERMMKALELEQERRAREVAEQQERERREAERLAAAEKQLKKQQNLAVFDTIGRQRPKRDKASSAGPLYTQPAIKNSQNPRPLTLSEVASFEGHRDRSKAQREARLEAEREAQLVAELAAKELQKQQNLALFDTIGRQRPKRDKASSAGPLYTQPAIKNSQNPRPLTLSEVASFEGHRDRSKAQREARLEAEREAQLVAEMAAKELRKQQNLALFDTIGRQRPKRDKASSAGPLFKKPDIIRSLGGPPLTSAQVLSLEKQSKAQKRSNALFAAAKAPAAALAQKEMRIKKNLETFQKLPPARTAKRSRASSAQALPRANVSGQPGVQVKAKSAGALLPPGKLQVGSASAGGSKRDISCRRLLTRRRPGTHDHSMIWVDRCCKEDLRRPGRKICRDRRLAGTR